jgi:amino acid adenylation domain-containing protein
VNCLHGLIEAQARRTPQRPALAFEGRCLDYAELERRASRLARHLQALGAGPEVRVGLLLERSLEMVLGILGILKAGAAYVPMDTAYPAERLAFMLADCGAGLLLTQRGLAPRLPPGAPRAVLVDEFDWSGPGEAPQSGARPENLAYVIYTSGSTGRPKGVGIEHRNIVNYVRGVAERLELEPGMSHATVSTIAADLGNTVIFPALATGGCLHVVSQGRAESPALLSEYFARERIDVLKIVPSHLAALHSGRAPQSVMPRRRLILGGEASRLDWIERLRAVAPQCRIHNHYGPTEATVGVLTYRVGAQLPATQTGTLPLGRALPGSTIYLLDGEGRPVAAGEKGELCIGGRGIARGYLNRPELAAGRFVADAFSSEPGARMYRTGDLARALPQGDIEFCGRVDHQVKVHGYRVELGEIEALLRAHGAVRDAVVLAREDASGDKRLVAFVAAQLSPSALREHLRERLPPYMVPAAFMLMEKLPLTPNGKIDRQALERLAGEVSGPAGASSAARGATEQTLASIWRELLDVGSVGVDDDVFDLGAHSLMAMRALGRIRDAFGVDLTLRSLFERPTIGGLAEIIDGLLSLARAQAPGAGAREEIVL